MIKPKYKKSIKFYFKQFKNDKKLWIPAVVLKIVVSVIGLIPAFYYKEILDIIYDSVGQDKSMLFSELLTILLIIAAINIIKLALWRLMDVLSIKFFINIRKRLYDQAYPYLMNHSYNFFTENMVGKLVSKLDKYVWSFESILTRVFFDIIPILFLIVGSTIVISYYSPLVGGIILGWFLIYLIVQIVLYKWWYPLSVRVNKLQSKISGSVADSIGNYYNVKIFGSLEREYSKISEKIDNWLDKDWERWLKAMVIWTISGLLALSLEFVVFYVLLKQWSMGLVTIGVFAMVQSYITQIISKSWSIGHIIRNLVRSISRTAEMIEILHTDHDIQDIQNASSLEVTDGEIKFDDVSFAYGSEEKVFENLNITIKPGEKLAFVGESGAGKSSLVKLLFRLYNINDGRILIDGQDISKVTQQTLRKNISMVPQEPVLFHRSIKDNIKYGSPDATDGELIEASKKAKCHKFITKLDKGYDTLVGERGVKLSGGEKQRVAIARAILENRKILVLDEATSALDSKAERQIQSAMEDAMKGKTAILIAHRLSTVMDMDRIIVLDEGQIVQTGTHQELISQKGLYKNLWELQSCSI